VTGGAPARPRDVSRDPTPTARRRLEDAARARDAVLLIAVLLHALPGACRSLAPAPPRELPPPLRIDLARDDETRLVLLPGIGRTRARAIVADREENGPVEALEDLLRVPGLGPGTVEGLRRARGVRLVPRGEGGGGAAGDGEAGAPR
jgi:competence ComEA-like helix-hairpin-helix protein